MSRPWDSQTRLRVELLIDVALILGLTLFVGLIMVFQYDARLLYYDNFGLYGMFRDQLHSLNHFGEIGWWAPHYQSGWPAYYYGILGDNNCSSPLFVLWGSLSWIAGRLGFQTDTFYLVYLINFAFVTPLLSTLGAYAVLRQLFHNRTVIRYALILAAMSPSVALNATSAGVLETLMYGLYFLAAYLHFLRSPSRLSFWLLGLTTCILTLTANYLSLVVNAVLLLATVAVITLVPRRGWRRFVTALARIPRRHVAALVVCASICILPSLITFSQGRDIIRTRAGDAGYDLDKMAVGTPLIGLIASTPNFGFAPVPSPNGAEFMTLAPSNTPCVTSSGDYSKQAVGFDYYYLGMLCLPLVSVAICWAKPRVRRQLLILLAVVFGMMCLVMYSPVWALVLRLVKLLRTNNHFGGTTCIAAGTPILIVAAAAGLQVVLDGHRGDMRRRVQVLFCVFAAISVILFVACLGQRVWGMPAFGFMLVLAFLYVPVLGWLRPGARGRHRGSAAGFLLLLVCLDSGTFLHINLREIRIHTPYIHEVVDKPLPGKAGFESSIGDFANFMMSYRQLYDMVAKGLDPGQLPQGALSVKGHACQDVSREKQALESARSNPQALSIALDEDFAKRPEFAPFLPGAAAAQDPSELSGNVTTDRGSYNSLTVRASCSRACLLFLRTAYSPYWSAEIDSKPVPIARAWFNFQAIPLPQGPCEVHLRFTPPWIRPALVLAYLVLFGIVGACCYFQLRQTPADPSRAVPEVQLA